jgi:hypothetical protein
MGGASDPNRDRPDPVLSRRELLASGGALGGLALFGGSSCGVAGVAIADALTLGATQLRGFPSGTRGLVASFLTRPDLRVPHVAVSGSARSPGYICLGPGQNAAFNAPPGPHEAQQGPLLVDNEGEPVWFRPLSGTHWGTNVRVGSYRGEPVLTWWEGQVYDIGYGKGEGVIVDTSYREVARVRAGNGREADLHEFVLTRSGTALITCYPETVRTDLSSVGGPVGGQALGSIIQEVDVASGRVVMEWHSLDHISVDESYQPYNEPYDYAHINSIDVLPDGNLLVSGRATWALYKLDRRSGEIVWRLAGKRSDFKLGPGVRFAWQHHATYLEGDRISLFDDRAGPVTTGPQSRAIVVRVNWGRRTVQLEEAYHHPHPLVAAAMGSVQLLDDGEVLVGWGDQHYISQFGSSGKLQLDATVPSGQFSYRAFRHEWAARPHDPPVAVSRRDARTGSRALYVSWNGATDVVAWRVDAGATANDLTPLGTAVRRGFETGIPLPSVQGYAAVVALDASARELARSAVIAL